MQRVLFLSAISAALLLVAACSAPAPIVIGCPTLHPWTAAEQAEMKRELHALPSNGGDPVMIAVMRDYIRMRDEARACLPPPPPKKSGFWPFG